MWNYVSIHGILLLSAGIAIILTRSEFNLPRGVLYLGILLAGLGLVSLLEAATTLEAP